LQARGLADGLQKGRDLFDRRYIRHNEYIIPPLSFC
jgi:hypothetical protein